MALSRKSYSPRKTDRKRRNNYERVRGLKAMEKPIDVDGDFARTFGRVFDRMIESLDDFLSKYANLNK